MLKYDFKNDNLEEIDQPSIVKINKSLISITHASGTDYTNIPDDGQLVIQIGNIDSFDPPTPDPDPEPTPTPDPEPIPTGGITMTAMIINNAKGTLNIKNISLLLWNDTELRIENVTGVVTTNNRIEQGNTNHCTIVFGEEMNDYVGLHFTSSEQYSQEDYLCNCGYKIQNNNYFFTTSDISSSYIFDDNGSFTVAIPSNTTEWTGNGQTPDYDTDPEPTPSGDTDQSLNDNQIKIIIKNDYSQPASFCGYLRFKIVEDQSGQDRGDFCFRENRYYPADSITGPWVYDTSGTTPVKVSKYKFGANTEYLAQGLSLSIICTYRMANHSSSNVSAESLTDLFGNHFKQTTSVGDNDDAIKLSISIDRSNQQAGRIDEYPNYYALRFTDKNGNTLSNNPLIKSKGVYYLSIYSLKSLIDWTQGWNIIQHTSPTSGDILSTNYVTVN